MHANRDENFQPFQLPLLEGNHTHFQKEGNSASSRLFRFCFTDFLAGNPYPLPIFSCSPQCSCVTVEFRSGIYLTRVTPIPFITEKIAHWDAFSFPEGFLLFQKFLGAQSWCLLLVCLLGLFQPRLVRSTTGNFGFLPPWGVNVPGSRTTSFLWLQKEQVIGLYF